MIMYVNKRHTDRYTMSRTYIETSNTIPGFRPDQPRVIGVHLTGGQRSPVGRQCPISFAGIWMAARSISIYTLFALFNISLLYYYFPLHLRNTIKISVALLQCVVSMPAPSWLHAYLPTSVFLNLLNIELWFEPYNHSILKHHFSVKAVPLDLQDIPIAFSPSLTYSQSSNFQTHQRQSR